MNPILSLVLSAMLLLSVTTPAVAVPVASATSALGADHAAIHPGAAPAAAVADPTEPNDDFDTAVLVEANQQTAVRVDPADVDVYAVSVPQTVPFTVELRRTAGFGTVAVVVYGPDREQTTYEYVTSAAPAQLRVVPVEPGTYYVQVVAVAQAAGTYQFAVVTDQLPPVAGEPDDDPSLAGHVERGDSVTGTVDVAADADWYRFESDGSTLEFVVSRPAGGSGLLGATFFDGETLLPVHTPPFDVPADRPLAVTGQLPAGVYYVAMTSSDRSTDDYTIEYVDPSVGSTTAWSDPAPEPKRVSSSGEPSTVDRLLSAETPPAIAEFRNQYVVFLPELTELPEGDREAVIAALKAHAEETQAPVIRVLEANDVEVVNTFWLANAIVVEVDPERVENAPAGVEKWLERVVPGVETVVSNEPVWTIEDTRTATAAGTLRATVDERSAATVHSAVGPSSPVEPATAAAKSRTVGAHGQIAPGGDSGAAADGIRTTYGLEQVRATEVWEEFDTRGAGVTVAVLDSGVDASHPDIDLYTSDPSDPTYPGGWIQYDPSGVPIEGSVPNDLVGHGTHVSATVAGGATGGVAVGVAPDVRLLHAGIGIGDTLRISTAGAIAGIQWATENGADVVSMSFGSSVPDTRYILPTRQATAAGVLLITSSGNNGPDVVGSPADVYDIVSVGAADPTERIAPWSSGTVVDTSARWGPSAPANWPDQFVVPTVAGPGAAVLSAKTDDGGYVPLSGTSMAAPHVAGVAALVIAAADRDVSPGEVREALVTTARTPSGAPAGADTRYGAGLVDALAAAQAIAEPTPEPAEPTTGPDANSTSPPESADARTVRQAPAA